MKIQSGFKQLQPCRDDIYIISIAQLSIDLFKVYAVLLSLRFWITVKCCIIVFSLEDMLWI